MSFLMWSTPRKLHSIAQKLNKNLLEKQKSGICWRCHVDVIKDGHENHTQILWELKVFVLGVGY